MSERMTPRERRVALLIGGLIGLRMLGLFMILPVFALYAHQLHGVTPFLTGLAIGVYGLTQAALQIPFGMLSDRLGRKPVITAGLLIFAVGSVVAALADSIYGVILGRALQGAGAISAALMALTADLTREEHRTKAMGVVGMSIGLSFVVALVLGPLLDQWVGVPGIFWIICALALFAVVVLHWQIPTPAHTRFHRDAEPVPAQFRRILGDSGLLRLDAGILLLHAQITALFVVLPLALSQEAGLPPAHHWYVYLPVLVTAILLIVPFIILAEKRRMLKQIFVGAVALLSLSQFALAGLHAQLPWLVLGLLGFFIAFNLLEASLPSLISKTAPPDSKGTAMGVYSTAQFLGAFLGGAGGGWVHQHYGISAVFVFCGVLSLLWLGLAATMRQPSYLSSHMLRVGPLSQGEATGLSQRLRQVPGVREAVVIIEDEVAYLKIDRAQIDMAALEPFSVAGADA